MRNSKTHNGHKYPAAQIGQQKRPKPPRHSDGHEIGAGVQHYAERHGTKPGLPPALLNVRVGQHARVAVTGTAADQTLTFSYNPASQ
jgi:hypothetical protein